MYCSLYDVITGILRDHRNPIFAKAPTQNLTVIQKFSLYPLTYDAMHN